MELIIHAVATSFIDMHRLATSQVGQSMLKTLDLNGANGECASK